MNVQLLKCLHLHIVYIIYGGCVLRKYIILNYAHSTELLLKCFIFYWLSDFISFISI